MSNSWIVFKDDQIPFIVTTQQSLQVLQGLKSVSFKKVSENIPKNPKKSPKFRKNQKNPKIQKLPKKVPKNAPLCWNSIFASKTCISCYTGVDPQDNLTGSSPVHRFNRGFWDFIGNFLDFWIFLIFFRFLVIFLDFLEYCKTLF